MQSRRVVLLACVCTCWVGVAAHSPSVAHAYEDQYSLGVGAGYANSVSDSQPQHGLMFDVAGSLGLTNVWTVRARVSYAFHPDDEPLHVGLLGAEILYLFDVVEVVPYFGLGMDGMTRARFGHVNVDAASHVVIGLDYLLSRDVTLGVDGRAYAIWTSLDQDPLYIAAIVSLSWMFDR